MASDRLEVVSCTFDSKSEIIHDKFLAITQDVSCLGCQSAGFGEAILTAWLQTLWGDFTHDLLIASALGILRTNGYHMEAVPGITSETEARRAIKQAAESAQKNLGFQAPVWHAPRFVIEVSHIVCLSNRQNIELVLGSSVVPGQITVFRNYLVHPTGENRIRYERLQASLGMLNFEPEELLHQHQSPGLRVFTMWIRELQRMANASAN